MPLYGTLLDVVHEHCKSVQNRPEYTMFVSRVDTSMYLHEVASNLDLSNFLWAGLPLFKLPALVMNHVYTGQ